MNSKAINLSVLEEQKVGYPKHGSRGIRPISRVKTIKLNGPYLFYLTFYQHTIPKTPHGLKQFFVLPKILILV